MLVGHDAGGVGVSIERISGEPAAGLTVGQPWPKDEIM